MKKRSSTPKTIRNRRASFDYTLGDSFVLGMVLTGRETKALRMGHGHLKGAYVTINGGELWLLNATITSVPGVEITDSEQTRSRKLLAKKREIKEFIAAKEQGNTLIPTEILTGGRHIKLRVAIARGKRQYDKRQTIKARDEARAIRQVNR